MMLTIKEENLRFNGRAGIIIYNEDKSKVLIENQENDRYVFPGGRIDVFEDSKTAIIRELKEELDITPEVSLKYILELFLDTSKVKYHEIGFYYLCQISENEIIDKFNSLDGSGTFEWVEVSALGNYDMICRPIKEKIINHKIVNDDLEYLIYKK